MYRLITFLILAGLLSQQDCLSQDSQTGKNAIFFYGGTGWIPHYSVHSSGPETDYFSAADSRWNSGLGAGYRRTLVKSLGATLLLERRNLEYDAHRAWEYLGQLEEGYSYHPYFKPSFFSLSSVFLGLDYSLTSGKWTLIPRIYGGRTSIRIEMPSVYFTQEELQAGEGTEISVYYEHTGQNSGWSIQPSIHLQYQLSRTFGLFFRSNYLASFLQITQQENKWITNYDTGNCEYTPDGEVLFCHPEYTGESRIVTLSSRIELLIMGMGISINF